MALRNISSGVAYTLSPAATSGDYGRTLLITDTDADWKQTVSGAANNGFHIQPIRTGALAWDDVGSSPGAVIRFDFAVDTAATLLRVLGSHEYTTYGWVTPDAITVEYSDDDSAWTTVAARTGLTRTVAGNKGYWVADFDISDEDAHQYWRVVLEEASADIYDWLGLTDVQFWADGTEGGGGSGPGGGGGAVSPISIFDESVFVST